MNDTQELLLNLIDYAKTNRHTRFEQLRFFSEYAGARVTYRATKKVVVVLEESADSLFKKYCEDVKQQQADVNLLLAYKQLQQAVNFYKEESKIIKDILEDYENYLWEGNFLKAFLFEEERDIWNLH
jgi:hypothetical protein